MSDIKKTFNILAKSGGQKRPITPIGYREYIPDCVRWFAKRPSGHPTLGGVAKTPEELESVAAASVRGWDSYIQLNPSGSDPMKRANAAMVTHWSFILLDLDLVGSGRLLQSSLLAMDDVILAAEEELEMLLTPTVVFTGHGAQAWIHLSPNPIIIHKGKPEGTASEFGITKEIAENTTRNFLKFLAKKVPNGYRLDILADLPRLARLPRSSHSSTKQLAYISQWGFKNDISKLLIDKFYTPIEYEIKSDIAFKGSPAWGQLDWRDVYGRLTDKAKAYMDYGSSTGARHDNAWHLATLLEEKGVSYNRSSEALRIADKNPQIGPAQPDPLGIDERIRILLQVYKEN